MPEAETMRPGDPGQLGTFRLTGRLGEGGQGIVYSGLSATGEAVAVKLLHTRFTGNPRARAAFAQELTAAQKVDPFCTARILAADVEGDIPYIASEYIHGLSLKRTVEEWGPRAGSQLNRLAIGTATALVAIHKAGVVHRDFKPSNVLLGPDGPRVIDFGVARALDLSSTSVSSGGPVGTPAYMAPEQFERTPLTTAVDVFAWASTLVYASCGRPPFGNESISVVINRILHGEPDLGALTGGLRELATACLHKDPRRRPTAEQLLLDLIGTGRSDAIGRQPVAPQPVRPVSTFSATGDTGEPGHTTVSRLEIRAAQRAERKRDQNRNLIVAGAVATLLVAVLGIFLLRPSSDDGEQDPQGGASQAVQTDGATPTVKPPVGTPISLTSTANVSYTIQAVEGGVESREGQKYAYIDYVLSNPLTRPVPLEKPGDLFLDKDQVTEGTRSMVQPGAADGMVTTGNDTRIVARIEGSGPVFQDQDGQDMMAAAGSYMLRIQTTDPVRSTLDPDKDLKLYVWQPIFVTDRKARLIPFPG
ncbi:MAG: serine/threonine-protein kinase [Streptosporangiaceae bacterium]